MDPLDVAALCAYLDVEEDVPIGIVAALPPRAVAALIDALVRPN